METMVELRRLAESTTCSANGSEYLYLSTQLVLYLVLIPFEYFKDQNGPHTSVCNKSNNPSPLSHDHVNGDLVILPNKQDSHTSSDWKSNNSNTPSFWSWTMCFLFTGLKKSYTILAVCQNSTPTAVCQKDKDIGLSPSYNGLRVAVYNGLKKSYTVLAVCQNSTPTAVCQKDKDISLSPSYNGLRVAVYKFPIVVVYSWLFTDIQYAGSDTRPPMLGRSNFESWQQHIHLYYLGKDNGENILKSIDEGPFKMGKFRETLAEGALHLGPERDRVFADLTPKEKERFKADIYAANILLQGLPKDIYTLINHNADAKDIWDNVKMLLEGLELTKDEHEL
nr:integrase, catalytic region, zinc finger, CCHC-type, peptidase aspartic, catalytic [Tanacetum cinerariifolium]